MIAVIDYNAGNILSVENALTRCSCEYTVTSNADIILSADKVIFPGVGDAAYAMQELRKLGLDKVIPMIKAPFLGICLGMQLLCSHSQENDTECLGIVPNKVKFIDTDNKNKTPNIGWSNINNLVSPLFNDVSEGEFVYYVHSYGAEVNEYTICTSEHSSSFSGAIRKENFYGCQFHPEKSGDIGELIIKNFIGL